MISLYLLVPWVDISTLIINYKPFILGGSMEFPIITNHYQQHLIQ